MARKIVITSGKGGVGKTTVSANLGTKLANLGFRVLLVDTDIGLNNLDVVMGVENKVMFDILDVVNGKCRAKQALVQDNHHPSLYILPAPNSDPTSIITADKIADTLSTLEHFFDYILLDCPAGLDNGFHRAVYCANEAIVVVTPHVSSIRDAGKVVARLANYPLSSVKLVVNRVRGDMLMTGDSIAVERIIELLGTNILGVVPDDDAISALSAIGAIPSGTSSSRAFAILAENLHTGTKKIFDCTYRYRGIAGTIRRNLKRRI